MQRAWNVTESLKLTDKGKLSYRHDFFDIFERPQLDSFLSAISLSCSGSFDAISLSTSDSLSSSVCLSTSDDSIEDSIHVSSFYQEPNEYLSYQENIIKNNIPLSPLRNKHLQHIREKDIEHSRKIQSVRKRAAELHIKNEVELKIAEEKVFEEIVSSQQKLNEKSAVKIEKEIARREKLFQQYRHNRNSGGELLNELYNLSVTVTNLWSSFTSHKYLCENFESSLKEARVAHEKFREMFSLSIDNIQICTDAWLTEMEELKLRTQLLFSQLRKWMIDANKRSEEMSDIEEKRVEQVPKEDIEQNSELLQKVPTRIENVDEPVEKFEVVTDYDDIRPSFENIFKNYTHVLNNPSLKEMRTHISRVASLLSNAVSADNGKILTSICAKILKLCNCEQMIIAEKPVRYIKSEVFLHFIWITLFQKLIKQSNEILRDKTYALAMVLNEAMFRNSHLKPVVLGCLYKCCPLLIPQFLPRNSFDNNDDYLRNIGYIFNDDMCEETDLYFRRMQGCARLFAALFVTSASKADVHPFSMSACWRWLVNVITKPSAGGITAALIFEVLNVCGAKLLQQYNIQFLKLLKTTLEYTRTIIYSTVNPDEHAHVLRLEDFLNNAIANKQIDKPSSQLTIHFWNST